MTATDTQLACFGCGKAPGELRELLDRPGSTPTQLVHRENRTFDAERNTFLCTGCWLSAGMPDRPVDWERVAVRLHEFREAAKEEADL